APGPSGLASSRANAGCRARAPAAFQAAGCSTDCQSVRGVSAGPATDSTIAQAPRAHSSPAAKLTAAAQPAPAAQIRALRPQGAARVAPSVVCYSSCFAPGELGFGAGVAGFAAMTVGLLGLATLPMSVCERYSVHVPSAGCTVSAQGSTLPR